MQTELQHRAMQNDHGFGDEVARLSISNDLDRKELVQMVKQVIQEPSLESGPEEHKKRRRLSSAQTLKTPKKKKHLRPPEIVFSGSISCQIADLRSIIRYVFDESIKPKWFQITNVAQVNKVVLLLIPGLTSEDFGLKDFDKNALIDLSDVNNELKVFKDFFESALPTRAPGNGTKLYSTKHCLTSCPLTKNERKELLSKDKKITMYDLMVPVEKMLNNKYPCPSFFEDKLTGKQKEKWNEMQSNPEDWAETIKFEHEGSRTFAMDCEMCLAASGHVVTRVSLINFDNEVLLDEFIKPEEEITDYLTKYSGITPEKLEGVNTSLKDIQNKLLGIISEDDVLIGHSLENDLKVLKLRHKTVVDTSLIYEHTGGSSLKPSLRWLAQKYLNQFIQGDASGHDSIEDAKASLSLVKLKLQNGMGFGTFSSNATMELHKKINQKFFKTKSTDALRKTLFVDYSQGGVLMEDGVELGQRIQCTSDDEVVNTVVENVNEYAFILAKFKQAEYENGWVPKQDEPEQHRKKLTLEVYQSIARKVQTVIDSLPHNSLLIATTCSGDPKTMVRLQKQKKEFNQEFSANKSLQGSWTVKDEDQLKQAVGSARDCLSFVRLKLNTPSVPDNESAIAEDNDII